MVHLVILFFWLDFPQFLNITAPPPPLFGVELQFFYLASDIFRVLGGVNTIELHVVFQVEVPHGFKQDENHVFLVDICEVC